MTIEEILVKLDTYDYSTFQREALQAAILQQEAITPALLSIIERIASNPRFLDENSDFMGFTYALYLYSRNFGKNVLIHLLCNTLLTWEQRLRH